MRTGWNETKAPFTLLRFYAKNGEKNLRFCESFYTDLHKNAIQRRLSKTLSKVDIHKQGGFENQSERTKAEVFENVPIFSIELHKTGAM